MSTANYYHIVSLLFEKRPGYIVNLQVTWCFPGNPPMKKNGGSSPGDIFPVCRAKSAHVSMVITLKSVYMDCLSNRSGNRRQQTKRLEAIFQIPLIHIFRFFVWGGANVVLKKLQKQRHETKSIRFFRRNLQFFVGVVSLVNRSSVRIQDTVGSQRPLPTLDPGPSIFRRSGSQRWRASTSWPGRKDPSFRTSGSTLSKL